MARLAAVGIRKGRRGAGVWRTEAGWFHAVSAAHPWSVSGPFATRQEAERASRPTLAVSPAQAGVA